jgi:hypothetical protein
MLERRVLPELEIVALYNEGFSLRDLAKKYNVDKGVIKKRLLQHDTKLRTLSEANRTYSFDENIFHKIDSHEKAYWLGFIASDGSIYHNTLKIGLSFKDFTHLEKFRTFLKAEHPIHTYYPIVKGKKYKSCEFSIRSDIMIADLLKLNIGANKSMTLEPAPLKTKYLNSYLLGIVDGDGCFSVDKLGQMKMNIISSLPMCQFIMDTLVKHCDITPTKIGEEKRSKGMNYCYFGGNNKVKSIVDYLYQDTQVWLERKRNIVRDHFERN